jgi:LysR family transcriptional regulator, transcriptional activator of the cysJI operon
MNLHLLRIFLAVAERRSFSRAAEQLFISQPAVSKGVQALEAELDLALIERGIGSGKGVRLTESGVALADHARGIFALEKAATEEIRARVGLKRGRLLIGASTTVAGYWLAPYLKALMSLLPDIDVRVRMGNTDVITQALIACDIDLALVEGVVTDARVDSEHWRNDPLQVVVHPHAEFLQREQPRLRDLDEQVWLVREAGSGTHQVAERIMLENNIRPMRTIEIGSNEGIARAVAEGLGIAILPQRVVRELTAIGEIRSLDFPELFVLTRPLFLLQLKERPMSPLVRAFCQVLRTHEERG